jgi:hypothetical protein
MTASLRWLGALICVVGGALLITLAFAALLNGHGLWALLAAVGATVVLLLGAWSRPPGRALPSDPRPPWDMSLDDSHLRDGFQLLGIGVGIFMTPVLGLFALVVMAIGYCLGAPSIVYLGLGALILGPLLISASFILIRR